MKDEIIDCLAYDGKVSIKCISSRKIVETARKLHDLSPTASAALGRLLAITSIMGYELKTEVLATVTNGVPNIQLKVYADIINANILIYICRGRTKSTINIYISCNF